jgi:hypothetical protein
MCYLFGGQIKVGCRIEWKVVITFILWKEPTMRQVQLHNAMLMQEVQQLKSANVRRSRLIGVSIKKARRYPGLPFLEYYNADEVPSAEILRGNYEKQKVFDVDLSRSV